MRLVDADALVKAIDGNPFTTDSVKSYIRVSVAKMPTIEPQRWIPCSEEPDTDRNVFIARGEHEFITVCIGHYDHDSKQWYEDRNWFAKCLYDGLYWCEVPPLPEPYRENEP